MAVVPVAVHANEAFPSSLQDSSNNKPFFSKLFGCGCFSSHQKQQNRTAASRPITPNLTDHEQQRSEDKTIGRELFCPICMYYASQVFTMQCCGHSVCFVCTSEYFSCHGHRFSVVESSVVAATLACMHCAKPAFHAVCITQGGRVYEDSPAVMKMQLRQRNRLAMSGSGSITLPSPLKRGDGFDALAAKLVSYEQHANMLMTLPDTPVSETAAHDPNNVSSSGRSSPLAVPTLLPAPSARVSEKEGLNGRSRPSSASSLSSSGSGDCGRPPAGPNRALRPLTPSPAYDAAGALLPLSPADNDTNAAASAETDAAAAATAAAFVVALGGSDDVRASVSMVEAMVADIEQQECSQHCPTDTLDTSQQWPTINVPQP